MDIENENTVQADNTEVEANNSKPTEESQTDSNVENEEVEDKSDENESDSSEEEEQSDDEELTLEDIEFDGKEYAVPKELKEAFLRQSDYTKKTMEVAEQRKQVEAQQKEFNTQRETLQKQQQQYQENLESIVQIKTLDDQLKHLKDIDLTGSSMEEKLNFDRDLRIIQDKRNELEQGLKQKQQQTSFEQQQQLAKLEEDTKSKLQQEIKGWNNDLQSNLSEYAKSQGISDQFIESSMRYDPIAVKTMHKAYLYDQLAKKQFSKPKIQVKPAGKIQSGKSVVEKDPSKMSQSEYAQWRRKRINSKNN